MDDLIRRQDAIDALGNEPEVWTGEDEYAQGLNNQWHYDRNAIKAVPSAQPEILACGEGELSAQPEQQWIPCSEQEYPNDNREVEVTCEFTRYDGKKYRYTCHASYVHRYSIESTGYCNWEECDEYNEEEDKYYALPGWYERVHNWDDYSYCVIEDRVVAWRELPEPWKGEEHETD